MGQLFTILLLSYQQFHEKFLLFFHAIITVSQIFFCWFKLNKQRICFVNRRDWLATKHPMLCELHFEVKHLRRGEKCTLQWSMNPLTTVYSQKLLSKPSSWPTQQTIWGLPRKGSFPDELSTFRDVIRTFQNLNESSAPAGFHLKN